MYVIMDTLENKVFSREEDLTLARVDASTNFPDGKVAIIDEETGKQVPLW